MPAHDGGLGQAFVGEKLVMNNRNVQVTKLLGEGGFSYVYLVKEMLDGSAPDANNSGRSSRTGANGSGGGKRTGSLGKGESNKVEMVLKVTSILSRQQRDIAEKEAKLLSRLSHPSIIKMFDTCYRTAPAKHKRDEAGKSKDRPQHLILMEFCEGGHALDVCTHLAGKGERFDLSSLIIAFGQICNAVSYLHAQRPPIVHRDLKPANFLIKNGAYKLCDFGSAVFGHVKLETPEARSEAEEVIQKTTTQMFRAPEMVDLFMAKKLTQATDVWALGCCLYSLAYLQNCFEEGSNLAILSRKYKIPDDNPYGEGLVELLDRMLTMDSKARADMTEVILCLSAVYSGRPLPPRKEKSKKNEELEEEPPGEKKVSSSSKPKKSKEKERVGAFRVDGQGLHDEGAVAPNEGRKEAKKLNPNSAAARRMKTSAGAGATTATVDQNFASFGSNFDSKGPQPKEAFGSSESMEPFNAFDNNDGGFEARQNIFASFEADEGVEHSRDAFEKNATWGPSPGGRFDEPFSSFGDKGEDDDHDMDDDEDEDHGPSAQDAPEGGSERRRRTTGNARPRRRQQQKKREDEDGIGESMEHMGIDDPHDDHNDDGDQRRGASRRMPTSRTGRVRRGNDPSKKESSRAAGRRPG